MAIEVPDWAAKTFGVVTGDAWPAANEDEIWELAQVWYEAADELASYVPEVAEAGNRILASGAIQGDAAVAMREAIAALTGESGQGLNDLAIGFREMGVFLHNVALTVEYTKIIILQQMAILFGQISYLIAMAPATFGASLAGVGALQTLGQITARMIVSRLVMAILSGVVLQVGLDAITQFAQMLKGSRGWDEWDTDLTSTATITGVVGGVVGLPVSMGSQALGGRIGKRLGKSGLPPG